MSLPGECISGVICDDTIIVRRARCAVCSTSLVMDYEWFEPNTIWLVRPTWTKVSCQNLLQSCADKIPKEGGKKVDVEKAFNGGLADMDVCWNSRGDPCSANTKYELN